LANSDQNPNWPILSNEHTFDRSCGNWEIGHPIRETTNPQSAVSSFYFSRIVNLRKPLVSLHFPFSFPPQLSVVLQPLVGPWLLFEFLNPIHSR
jgi:hypothetical protein